MKQKGMQNQQDIEKTKMWGSRFLVLEEDDVLENLDTKFEKAEDIKDETQNYVNEVFQEETSLENLEERPYMENMGSSRKRKESRKVNTHAILEITSKGICKDKIKGGLNRGNAKRSMENLLEGLKQRPGSKRLHKHIGLIIGDFELGAPSTRPAINPI
ncbi:unnamed protein product [Vicia faba]|uniref:Uncharacterized protein n=1 Tax=Vicia faba TaxID=3906 RepID=A0AAV0YSF8_VICFA|nr:unnamed protein product [Vicia faba]